MAIRKWLGRIIFAVILVVAAAHAFEFVRGYRSRCADAAARKILKIGDDISDARARLIDNGVSVLEIERRNGQAVMCIRISEISGFDSFRYISGINLTPLVPDVKHWIVVRTGLGTKKVAEIITK